ncbi:MAG: hypothetical protein MI919_13460, partial [Holophagales bacterium]|nr:hypothetical protein [Holophagales bacterium]
MAPKSWQEASAAVLGVNLFIEQTPEKDAEARIQGEEAHKLALHALFVSREVKKVQSLGRKGLWEDVVLGFEAYLGRLAEVSGAGRVSFMSLDDQTKAIESHVDGLSVAAVEPESVEAVPVSEPPAEEITLEDAVDGAM